MPSFYRPKNPGVASDADVRHGTRFEGAENPGTANDESVWAGRRKAQPADILLPATRRWLDSLSSESRPNALASRFPRVANLVAANWSNPGDCSAYIFSLLHDQRPGRRGFPKEVIQDIVNLRFCYARLHPIIDWHVDAAADARRYEQEDDPSAAKGDEVSVRTRMPTSPKERGVVYRGVNVALQAIPANDGSGRFIGTCTVAHGPLSRTAGSTSETYATEEQALAAIRRRVPHKVEDMFRNGELPEP